MFAPRVKWIIVSISLLFAVTASAELASYDQARQVCQNWLTNVVSLQGDWAGSAQPRILSADEVIFKDTLLGYSFAIEPSGYVLVPIFMGLAPVKSSSQTSAFSAQSEGGFSLLARESLYDRWQRYSDLHGDPSGPPVFSAELPLSEINGQAWSRFLAESGDFQVDQPGKPSARNEVFGPLLTTAWHQGSPYNDNCPEGDGGLCIVGCVATAMAQIIVYHGWPNIGEGRSQYYWNGDGSCGGVPRAETLGAQYDDPYEMDLMPDVCTTDSPQRIKDAVAELCFEVAVSVNMNFGRCFSGTNMILAQTALPEYFRYLNQAIRDDRSDHTPASWLQLLKSEVSRGNPTLYSFRLAEGGGHAIVCDGWLEMGGIEQIHLNYGWADSHTSWYSLDDIFLSADPRAETILRNIVPDQSMSSVEETLVGRITPHSLKASPNPFNPRTQISFELPGPTVVSVRIFDFAGHLVKTVAANEELVAGTHTLEWEGRDSRGRAVPSGTYFYRLEAGQNAQTKRMTLIR